MVALRSDQRAKSHYSLIIGRMKVWTMVAVSYLKPVEDGLFMLSYIVTSIYFSAEKLIIDVLKLTMYVIYLKVSYLKIMFSSLVKNKLTYIVHEHVCCSYSRIGILLFMKSIIYQRFILLILLLVCSGSFIYSASLLHLQI